MNDRTEVYRILRRDARSLAKKIVTIFDAIGMAGLMLRADLKREAESVIVRTDWLDSDDKKRKNAKPRRKKSRKP